MIEDREMSSRQLTNGKVLKAHLELRNRDGQIHAIPQIYWIRGRNRARSVSERVLRLEGNGHGIIDVPMIDILDGRHDSIVFEGVYSPRRLGLVDPRVANRRMLLDQ